MKKQKVNQFIDFQQTMISIDQQTQLKGGFIVDDAEGFIVEEDAVGI